MLLRTDVNVLKLAELSADDARFVYPRPFLYCYCKFKSYPSSCAVRVFFTSLLYVLLPYLLSQSVLSVLECNLLSFIACGYCVSFW